MFVGDIMKAAPTCIAPKESLETARRRMVGGSFKHLPVLEDGNLVGIVSQRDVLRYRGSLLSPVVGAMSRPVEWIAPDSTVGEAAATMVNGGFGCLPVVVDGNLVGIVTTTDLLVVQSYCEE